MLSKIWYCEVCDHEYCLAGKTQHLKTVKHNKNFLNRPLELDQLEPEDESIETLLKVQIKWFFLFPNLKQQQKSRRKPFTVS